jgi:restriction endonuclease S subunit
LKIFYAFGQGASQLGRWRLPTEAFNEFALPYPTLSEQTRISDFLALETAKIDALIEEQRRLIELLKEKRQAVISHAVTKGLNPSAPMKDSGIEWLGPVPEHWKVHSFRHHLNSVFNGLTADQIDRGPDTVAVTRIETISRGVINFEKVGYIRSEDAREDRKLLSGDVLFSNINSLNMIGNCARYSGDGILFAGMNLLVLRPRESINPIWLYWLVKSTQFREEVESLAKPAINQASISQSSICAIPVPTPAYKEQVAIAIFLDHVTAKLDELIGEGDCAIDLLQERRNALISATVTGKIDVRNYVPKEAA